MTPKPLAVTAEGLGLRGTHGWVYRGIDLTADPGDLVAVVGPAGSGRTALLLALAGRMEFTTGTALLGRYRLPEQHRQIRRQVSLALVPGVNDLDPALTVGEHVRERLLLAGRLPRQAAVTTALRDTDLTPDTLVRHLDPADRQLLGLALARLDQPGLIVLDDIDADLSAADQRALWIRLRRATPVTTIVACHDATPAEGVADTVVQLTR